LIEFLRTRGVSYDEIRLRLMVGLRWKIDITAANSILQIRARPIAIVAGALVVGYLLGRLGHNS